MIFDTRSIGPPNYSSTSALERFLHANNPTSQDLRGGTR